MGRPKRRRWRNVGVHHTYDALDDKILALYTSNPRPSFNEIKAQIPGATQSRMVRAMWRSKREAKMKQPKLEAVTSDTVAEPLSDLRQIVQRFVQEVSSHHEPIQDMSITITTAKGTVAVKMSQEVKPAASK